MLLFVNVSPSRAALIVVGRITFAMSVLLASLTSSLSGICFQPSPSFHSIDRPSTAALSQKGRSLPLIDGSRVNAFQIRFAEGAEWTAEELYYHYNREMREQGYDAVLQAQRRGIVKSNWARKEIRSRLIRDRKRDSAAMKRFIKHENPLAVFDFKYISKRLSDIQKFEAAQQQSNLTGGSNGTNCISSSDSVDHNNYSGGRDDQLDDPSSPHGVVNHL